MFFFFAVYLFPKYKVGSTPLDVFDFFFGFFSIDKKTKMFKLLGD